MTVYTPNYSVVLLGSPNVSLSPQPGGSIILDDSVASHVQAQINVPASDQSVLDALDPRVRPRVRITANGRVFNLALRERPVQVRPGVASLTLSSDEALLEDYAPLSDDVTPRMHEGSLRAVVAYILSKAAPGATLAPGPDADVTAYWKVINLIKNPVAHSGVEGWHNANGNSGIPTRSANGGPFNEPHFILTATASGDIGGYYTGTDNPVTKPSSAPARQGEPYTFSVYMRASAAGKQARVVIRFADGTSFFDVGTSNAAISNTGWLRFSVTAKVPPGFTGIAAYVVGVGFAAGEQLYWAAAMLYAGAEVVSAFVPGYTPNDANYTYTWEAGPHDSASTRTPTVERLPETLTHRAGVSGLDFLAPLVQAAGFRLVCNESRVFSLRNADYIASGSVSIRQGVNLIDGSHVISRSSRLWFDAQVTRYRWTDSFGIQQERADSFALITPPTLVNEVSINAPYPGPGRSEYAVRRAQGRGREVTARSAADWTAQAEQAVTIVMENTPIQIGKSSRVDFDLDRNEMTISTRTTDTPAGAIDLLPGTINSLVGTIDNL